jgi:hypothetical protein
MNLLATAVRLLPLLADASDDWGDSAEDLRPTEFERRYKVVDLRDDAASVRYRPSKRRKALGLRGRVKRTRYAPVDLRTRRVVLVVHQTGFIAGRSIERLAKKITAHEVWNPDGTVYVVHPDNTRLVAANRLDRSPYHAINFETVGNFSGIEGQEQFFRPERLGRSFVTSELAEMMEARLVDRIRGLREIGIDPYMLAPHRIAGRNEHGEPNRQICCGSGIWSVAERVAAQTGVPVPGDDFELGGLPIPASWRTEAYAECRRVNA